MIGDMHDQGIEQRAALGGEDRGHGFAIGGVGAQAVDRLGGEGDQAAVRCRILAASAMPLASAGAILV